jgi:DNA polymerase III delta prime subunit
MENIIRRNMPKIIFVSGPCGSGKSTFADAYARHLVQCGHKTVYVIHGDDFHGGFVEPEEKDDFFVDDGFGNDTSDHMEVSAERDATDSSIVHYTVSIENVFGDRDLIVQDVVLSGCYPVLALVAQEVTLRVGQTFDPLSYVARAEREEGISAMKEVAVNGKVDTTRTGEYDLMYTLGGEAVSLHIIVE